MNAFDESLTSNAEHAAGRHHPPFAPTAEPQGRAPGSSIDSWLLTRLRAFLGDPPVEFAVRGRALVGPTDVAPVARVTFANRRTLMPILADPALRFGDAYAEGSVAIDGDLVSLLEAVYRSGAAAGKSASLLTRARGALRRPHPNSLAARATTSTSTTISATSSTPCGWARPWRTPVPTIRAPQATLEQAQIAKMDHVCRKLRLQRGRLRGRGRLRLGQPRAAHGEPLRCAACAPSTSRANRSSLRASVPRAGTRWSGRVHRGRLPQHQRPLRRVRLGRHARARRARELPGSSAEWCARALRADGRGLIHSIGRNQPAPLHPWIERRIFPGAYRAVPGRDDARSSSRQPLGARRREHSPALCADAASLARALRVRRRPVRAMFDEFFVRMWRLYLAGSIAAFETGTLQLFQVLFTTAQNNDIPLTREYHVSALTPRLKMRSCRGHRSSAAGPPALRPRGRLKRAGADVLVLDKAALSAAQAVRRLDHPGGGRAIWTLDVAAYPAPLPELPPAAHAPQGAGSCRCRACSTRSAASSSMRGCSSVPARSVEQHTCEHIESDGRAVRDR